MIILISAAFAALIFTLIILCLKKSAERKDVIQKRLDRLGMEVTMSVLAGKDDLSAPFTERILKPLIRRVFSHLSALLPKTGRGGKEEKLLQQAGWAISVVEYGALRLIFMTGAAFAGLVIGAVSGKGAAGMIKLFLFGGFAAYALLRYVTASSAAKRRAAMQAQLPDVLDLLSVSVAAGLGFERALLHVIQTMEGPLVDEFTVTYREMTMGRTRKEALTLLGERCGIEDLSAVTGALVQAGQLGIPIVNVLSAQAAALRRSRRAKVSEQAAKVSTKMLLPMVGLIFPVLIIILLGPSLITIIEQFK